MTEGIAVTDDIRGIYASASLKLYRGRMVRRLYAQYPRHLRLGLIEARPFPHGGRSERHDIRGIYASASLKRLLCLVIIPIFVISEAFTPRPH